MKRILLALLLGLPLAAGAATVTPRVNTPDTGDTPNSSASFTPAAGELLVVGVCASNTGALTGTLSSSVSGFTFTQVQDLPYSFASLHHMFLYVADAPATAVSQTVTFTPAADPANGTNIMVAGVAGISLDGADAVRQTAEKNVAGTSDLNPVFSVNALTGNPTLGFLCMDAGPSDMTPPTGWTEGGEIDFITPLQTGEWVYRNSGFTSTTILWGEQNPSGTAAVMSMELDASSTATPGFDVTPNVAFLDTDTYRITYDATSAGGALHAVVKFKGSAACTCDAIEANTCAGEISYATEATTGSADSKDINVTLPAGDPLPMNDLDICIENAGVDSAVFEQDDELLAEPTGVNFVQASGAPAVGEVGLFDGASPPVVNGDTMVVVEACDSFALGADTKGIILSPDQTFVIDAGGDTSRQVCGRRFADYSAQAWSDAALVPKAINDLPPVYADATAYMLVERDDPFVVELDSLWQDPEGDAMTHQVDNVPPSGSVDGENLEGPLDIYGEYTTPLLRAIDEFGEETEQGITIEVGLVLPDFTAFLLAHPFGMDRAYGP